MSTVLGVSCRGPRRATVQPIRQALVPGSSCAENSRRAGTGEVQNSIAVTLKMEKEKTVVHEDVARTIQRSWSTSLITGVLSRRHLKQRYRQRTATLEVSSLRATQHISK